MSHDASSIRYLEFRDNDKRNTPSSNSKTARDSSLSPNKMNTDQTRQNETDFLLNEENRNQGMHNTASSEITVPPPLDTPIREAQDKRIRYNTRTPNLDRIATFFKGGKSPTKENLMKKFEICHLEDTPDRKKDTPSKHNDLCGGKTPNTDIINKRSIFTKSNSFDNRDSVMDLVMAHSDEEVLGSNHYHDDSPYAEFGNKIAETTKPIGREVDVHPRGVELENSLVEKNTDTALSLNQEVEISTQLKDVPGSPKNSINGDGDVNDQSLLINCCTEIENFVEGTPKRPPKGFRRRMSSSRNNETSLAFTGKSKNTLNTIGDVHASAESTRVDDTTADPISPPWIFRHNLSEAFNSNKSTQVIKCTETQHSSSEQVLASTECRLQERRDEKSENYETTQIIASFASQPILSLETNGTNGKENGLECSTQIIKSQEGATQPDLNTSNMARTNFETILEVPETSSPSKPRHDRNNQPIFSAECEATQPPVLDKEEGSQDRVHLEISSKVDFTPNEERDQGHSLENKQEFDVIISEAEYTQDLPEVEEDYTQDIDEINIEKFSAAAPKREELISTPTTTGTGKHLNPTPTDDDSGKNSQLCSRTNKRRKIRNKEQNQIRTPLLSPNRLGTDSKISNEVSSMKFPSVILSKDKEFLSEGDIVFEDGVWCQYSLDYNYYPGRIVSCAVEPDNSWVCFDSGTSLTKNDDIYYLDIRVGDTVNFKGKKHVVVALECSSRASDVIRCIRGFDLVHLKKRAFSGKLTKKTIVRPLAEISLDVNEWTKRRKIMQGVGSVGSDITHDDLRHPIRGRKNTIQLSPRKAKGNGNSKYTSVYRENSSSDNSDDLTHESSPKSSLYRPSVFDLSGNINTENKIFEKCLFAFTGLDGERTELIDVVCSLGGEIIESGFSNLFDYESTQESIAGLSKFRLDIHMNDASKFCDYKFACLITTQHSRSLKYLETLALKWPTLHWKFIKECIKRNELALNSINQYLLPSGESFRLSFGSVSSAGVVKSSNIIPFYENLQLGKTLEDQSIAMKYLMPNFTVIIDGSTNIDAFIKFTFSCFGVIDLYQVDDKGNKTLKPFENLLKALDDTIGKKKTPNILIYVNTDNGISNSLLNDMRKEVGLHVRQLSNNPFKVYVEAKEWLIQTIINESLGLDD